ncbi:MULTISPECIES: hypothetical protein [Sodalis]|nr:hypothetical protein [Sodalis ligni]
MKISEWSTNLKSVLVFL